MRLMIWLINLLLYNQSYGSSITTYTTSTAATNKEINSKIFNQCIIEKGKFLLDPESFVVDLVDPVESDFPVQTSLFNRSAYGYVNDFVKEIFEYISPILDKAQVTASDYFSIHIFSFHSRHHQDSERMLYLPTYTICM
jgi:hypothetical protein